MKAANTPNYREHYPHAQNQDEAPKYSAYSPADAKGQPHVHVYPEVAPDSLPNVSYPKTVAPLKEEYHEDILAGNGRHRFCGLSKKMFLIGLVVLLVIVAAVVGGAIGGVLAG